MIFRILSSLHARKRAFIALSCIVFIVSTIQCSLEDRLFLPSSLSFENGTLVNQEGNVITLSHENSIIFFDWDGVMVDSDMTERLTKVIHYPLQTFKLIMGGLVGIIYPNYIFSAIRSSSTAEAIARAIAPKDRALAGYVLQLGNVNKPQKEMEYIVKQLAYLGYDLSVATNKEEELFSLEYKEPNLKKLYNLFPKILIVDPTENFESEAIYTDIIVKKSSVKKPMIDYYTIAEQQFNPDNKYILFIDDNVKNFDPIINQKINWIGLKFENPQQLKEDLITLRILPSESVS